MTAFEMLVDRHKDFAYLIAIRVVGIAEDAEEIAHDAFIKLLDKIRTFKGESKFTSWFYRLVMNLALAKLRKKRITLEDISGISNHENERSESDTAGHIQQEDQKKMLEKAIEKLGEEERVLITLYYYDELSLDEMEEITGLEKNTMKVKIFRARKKMAKSLHFLLQGEEAKIY